MALSNESGQAAYKNANPKINGEIIQAAQRSEQDAEQSTVDVIAKPESNLPELDGILSRPVANTSTDDNLQTLDEAADFPTGDYTPAISFTDRIAMLGKTGKLIYPEYRTLSQQQRASYEKAMSSPEYKRLARRNFEYDLDNQSSGVVAQVKNELVRYAGDLLSLDQTELWLGNMAATGDWSDLGSMAAQAAAWVGGKLTGAVGLILSPTELGDDTLPKDAKGRYDLAVRTYNRQIEQGMSKEAAGQMLAAAEERYKKESQEELSQTSQIPLNIPEDTKIQTIGKNIMNAALRNLEYKAAVLPQGTPYDREAFVGKLTGGASSMGELLLAGVGGRAIGTNVGRQVVRSGRATPAAAARFEAITGRKIAARTGTATASRAGIERVAQRIGGESGSAASLGLMTNDIMGGGAFESVRQYIEETGDTDLSEYQGDLKKVAIDAANATIQNWIEHKWGVAKFIKNPRLATKYGEWVNGFIQEFTQGEVNDFAEYIKSNQTAKEVFENVASNAQDGIIGALLQGATGTAVYHYNHTKSVADLRRIVMAQNPNISYAEADRFAERKVNELEENMVQDIAKDVVQFTDAQAYQGAIYEVVRANIEATINAQREAVKDTIDGSKFDEMSEQERAQYISQVAADEVDRITIAALESGIPLSEVPQLRGNVIDGTFYLEGSDYAKQTAAEAQAEREKVRRLVFESRAEAKRVAEEARQAVRNERLAADIAAGRERAARIRQERETAMQMKESDARLAALEKSEQAEQRQIAKWEKEYARQEAKRAAKIDKTRQSQTRAAIRGGNVDLIRQILSDNGYRTRDLSGTAIKNLALLNWELFENKSVGESMGKYEQRVARTAMEQNVESGNDVLRRAGFTDEQIGRMDDATWERAVLAAYKTENADELARIGKEQREINEALEQIDVDDIAYQEVETQSPMDLADENARLDDIYPAYTGETINIDGKERTVYNSNGERIAQSEPALRNFYKWFGDSKVVDSQGRPLVVYHGSDVSGIEVFANQANQTKQRQIGADRGYFFTDRKKVAERFRTETQRKAETQYYMENTVREPVDETRYDAQGRPVGTVHYVKTTPAPYKNFGLYGVYLKAENINEFNGEEIGTGVERDFALASAKANEKDGVIIYNADTGAGIANEYIVFEPNQIKSTENTGEFGIGVNNMYHQDQPQAKLIATHNMSKEGLERALDLGGLVMPSMAITKFTEGGVEAIEQIKQGTVFQNKKTSKSTTGLGTEHRGGYDPMTKAIIFNKTSDLTTLFHESAHYWFDRNLRYYRTGLASPEWKKKWEDVMNELGATPNARGTIPVSAIRSASEKFARSMEAYLREGKYESAAIQWAHQDYANMVKRVYRNIWSTYWGLDDLSPAVKQWFDMFGLKTDDATTAFAEEDKIETDEQMVGAVVAEDATKPDVDAETKTIVADAGAQVVENPATQEIAVVPADPFETGKKARSKLPRSAEAATGVSMDDIIYNRRSMSDAFKAAQQLVNTDPVRAWEILKGGQEMVDGLYAGDIYRALVAKYQAENNPTMLKNVVQAFAGAARRAGRSVKAFDLESPRISFEKTINSLDKIFDTKKNDKRIEKVKNELKEFLHDPSALRVGWEEFKNIVGCK